MDQQIHTMSYLDAGHTESAGTYKTPRQGGRDDFKTASHANASEEAEVSYLLDDDNEGDYSYTSTADTSLEVMEQDGGGTDMDMDMDDGGYHDNQGGLLVQGGVERGSGHGEASGGGKQQEQQQTSGDQGDIWAGYPALCDSLHAKGLTLYLTPECMQKLHGRVVSTFSSLSVPCGDSTHPHPACKSCLKANDQAVAQLPINPNPRAANIYVVHLRPDEDDPNGVRQAIVEHIMAKGDGMLMDYRWLETCLDVDLLLTADCRGPV